MNVGMVSIEIKAQLLSVSVTVWARGCVFCVVSISPVRVCVCVYFYSCRSTVELTRPGQTVPHLQLSQQPASPAQLISLFFYPVTFLPFADSAILPSVCVCVSVSRSTCV